MQVPQRTKKRCKPGFRRVEILLPEALIKGREQYYEPSTLNAFAAQATIEKLDRKEGMDREAQRKKQLQHRQELRAEIQAMIDSGELKLS